MLTGSDLSLCVCHVATRPKPGVTQRGVVGECHEGAITLIKGEGAVFCISSTSWSLYVLYAPL